MRRRLGLRVGLAGGLRRLRRGLDSLVGLRRRGRVLGRLGRLGRLVLLGSLVGESGQKWRKWAKVAKMGKSGENGQKWAKVAKMGKSGENGQKWETTEKSQKTKFGERHVASRWWSCKGTGGQCDELTMGCRLWWSFIVDLLSFGHLASMSRSTYSG